jgi:hypothetical protein
VWPAVIISMTTNSDVTLLRYLAILNPDLACVRACMFSTAAAASDRRRAGLGGRGRAVSRVLGGPGPARAGCCVCAAHRRSVHARRARQPARRGLLRDGTRACAAVGRSCASVSTGAVQTRRGRDPRVCACRPLHAQKTSAPLPRTRYSCCFHVADASIIFVSLAHPSSHHYFLHPRPSIDLPLRPCPAASMATLGRSRICRSRICRSRICRSRIWAGHVSGQVTYRSEARYPCRVLPPPPLCECRQPMVPWTPSAAARAAPNWRRWRGPARQPPCPCRRRRCRCRRQRGLRRLLRRPAECRRDAAFRADSSGPPRLMLQPSTGVGTCARTVVR